MSWPDETIGIDIKALRSMLVEGAEGKAWIDGLIDERIAEIREEERRHEDALANAAYMDEGRK
jgi:hypothetical protein